VSLRRKKEGKRREEKSIGKSLRGGFVINGAFFGRGDRKSICGKG
jgi:hypothetical protein